MAGLTWAGEIAGPKSQGGATRWVRRRWAGKDREAGEAWRTERGLPGDTWLNGPTPGPHSVPTDAVIIREALEAEKSGKSNGEPAENDSE